jgi:AcrR family transcriptional regulator
MSQRKYHHGDLKNALIEAGLAILESEGMEGLTLRQVAMRAGVSHAAPYAHFSDKQSLFAAISTEGFKHLYARIHRVVEANPNEPGIQLLEAAWVYVEYSIEKRSLFKLMFSGILQQAKQYPEFVFESRRNYNQVVDIVSRCQTAGLLRDGDSDLVAQGVWSTVHGFCCLLMEGQISHSILDRMPLKDVLVHILNPMLHKPYQTDSI